MSNTIAGKVVVITGASSGLGEATARLLSAQGASVVLGARRVDRIKSLADEPTSSGGKVLAIPTDVTHYDQIKRLVDAAVQTYGRIDVMLNNAGLMPQAPLERLKIDEWNQMIDVNIKGVLYGIAAALPYMQQQHAGHFINVSSVAGHKVRPPGTVYAAIKHAVLALSEGLRQEVKPYHIRTTVISPGQSPRNCPTAPPSRISPRPSAKTMRVPFLPTPDLVSAQHLPSYIERPSDAAGVFAIYPGNGVPPGSEKWTWHEQTMQVPMFESTAPTTMVRNVVIPTLTLFKPAAGTANSTSLIVAPGGAFRFLTMDSEGYDMARWLTQLGVTVFILRYWVAHMPENDTDMLVFMQNLMNVLPLQSCTEEKPPVGDEATKEARTWAEEDGR